MTIQVRVPTVLRNHTDGAATVEAKGDTLRDVVDDLGHQYPELRAALVTDDGELHRYVNVFANDEDVRFLGGLETPLADEDTVSILPAVAGGGR